MDVLRITRWGGYPELSGWVQYNHKEGRKVTGKKDMPTEGEAGVMCFEDVTEAMGHRTQVDLRSWKRQGNRCSPRRSCQLCGQLGLSTTKWLSPQL